MVVTLLVLVHVVVVRAIVRVVVVLIVLVLVHVVVVRLAVLVVVVLTAPYNFW